MTELTIVLLTIAALAGIGAIASGVMFIRTRRAPSDQVEEEAVNG